MRRRGAEKSKPTAERPGPAGIRGEIAQTKPFRTLRQEAVVALFRTTDLLRRYHVSAIGTHEITLQQFNVLRILRGAGDAGLPTMEIARRMIERTPGVTRLVDRLILRGWVERELSTRDRRRVVCRITARGRAALQLVDGPMIEAHDASLAALPERKVRTLLSLLQEIRTGLPPPAA